MTCVVFTYGLLTRIQVLAACSILNNYVHIYHSRIVEDKLYIDVARDNAWFIIAVLEKGGFTHINTVHI